MELNCFSTEIQNCPIEKKEKLQDFVEQQLLEIGKYGDIEESFEAQALANKFQHHIFVIGMLIREFWDASYQPRGLPKAAYPQYRPLGVLYERFLSMMERLKTFDELKKHPFPKGSPLEWTLEVMIEGELEGIDGMTKSECTRKIEKRLKSLRRLDDKRPDNQPLFNPKKAPTTFTLIKISKHYAGLSSNSNFRKRYWKSFIQAYSDWKQTYESKNWRPLTINLQTGQIQYKPPKSKRGMVTIVPPKKGVDP